MKPAVDVAVVGAGLAGTASAVALARAGYTVRLLGDGAGGASAIPAAVMAPYPTPPTDRLTRLRARGARYTMALLQRLDATGLDSGCRARGVLLLPGSERDRRRHTRARAGHDPWVEALEPDAAQWRVGVRPSGPGLLHHRGACVVPARFCSALRERAGVRLQRDHIAVGRLEPGDDTVALYDASGYRWGRAAHVVLAAGMATPALWPGVAHRLNPVRGQASAFQPSEAPAGLRSPVSSAGYITPPINGLLWVGGTAQPGDADPAPRAEDDRANLARLRVIDPDYPDGAVHGRFVGIRTVTPDRLPLVGSVDARVWVNTGHGAHGLMTAPWAGAWLARCLARSGR